MLNIYQGISCPTHFLRLSISMHICVPTGSATSLKEFPQDCFSLVNHFLAQFLNFSYNLNLHM